MLLILPTVGYRDGLSTTSAFFFNVSFKSSYLWAVGPLKESIPFLDELGYYVLYNRVNENFIDEEEKLQNEKIIERLKKSHELRMKPDLEKLMENQRLEKVEPKED